MASLRALAAVARTCARHPVTTVVVGLVLLIFCLGGAMTPDEDSYGGEV